MSTSTHATSLAARDDIGPLSFFQQCSAACVFSDSVDGTSAFTGVSWRYNIRSVSKAGAGATKVYTVNFQPFDFVGTTYPLFVFATCGRLTSGAPTTKLFPAWSIVDNKSIELRVSTNAGAYTDLGANDVLAVLILGRHNRKNTDGTRLIDALETLLGISNNLGVTGL